MATEMEKLAARLKHMPCPHCGVRHAGKHNTATKQADFAEENGIANPTPKSQVHLHALKKKLQKKSAAESRSVESHLQDPIIMAILGAVGGTAGGALGGHVLNTRIFSSPIPGYVGLSAMAGGLGGAFGGYMGAPKKSPEVQKLASMMQTLGKGVGMAGKALGVLPTGVGNVAGAALGAVGGAMTAPPGKRMAGAAAGSLSGIPGAAGFIAPTVAGKALGV